MKIHPTKQKVIDSIITFISQYDEITKMVIFGDVLEENVSEDTFIDIAIETLTEEIALDDNFAYNIVKEIDDITDGKFSFIIMNEPNISSNTMELIERGIIVYEKEKI